MAPANQNLLVLQIFQLTLEGAEGQPALLSHSLQPAHYEVVPDVVPLEEVWLELEPAPLAALAPGPVLLGALPGVPWPLPAPELGPVDGPPVDPGPEPVVAGPLEAGPPAPDPTDGVPPAPDPWPLPVTVGGPPGTPLPTEPDELPEVPPAEVPEPLPLPVLTGRPWPDVPEPASPDVVADAWLSLPAADPPRLTRHRPPEPSP